MLKQCRINGDATGVLKTMLVQRCLNGRNIVTMLSAPTEYDNEKLTGSFTEKPCSKPLERNVLYIPITPSVFIHFARDPM